MKVYDTIPIGYIAESQDKRYKSPHNQCLHWNKYNVNQYCTHEQVDLYKSTLRPFALYRDEKNIQNWSDFNEKLGVWCADFSTKNSNKKGKLESDRNFTLPNLREGQHEGEGLKHTK